MLLRSSQRIEGRNRKFGSAEELIRQLERDRENALRALTPLNAPDSLKGYSGTTNLTLPVA